MANCSLSSNLKLKGTVEEKIKNYKLSVLKDDNEYKKLYKPSPALKELQGGTSRVKRLSQLFEDKSRTFNRKTNWWLQEKVYNSMDESSSKIRENNFATPPARKSRLSEHLIESPAKFSKIERIVNELLQKELSYIQALERGIDYYVKVIKEGGEEVPLPLHHQIFRLFGNIEEIYDFHKNSLYPRLLECKGNVKRIAETISSFIQDEKLYCYIVYAINEKSSELLIAAYPNFFEKLRSNSDDLLGIHSFIIQPIQKLPRYKMLLDEMIKELSRDVLMLDKPAVAACCIAEKNVQRLLNRLNEALAVNEIIETHELEPSVLGVLSTIQKDFGVDINKPTMMLVPQACSNFSYQRPVGLFLDFMDFFLSLPIFQINIYSLGKFLKSSVLKAHETYTGKLFTSKVFIFEKCLLYTKMINSSTLGYRNHFSFEKGFAFCTQESHVSFRISGVSKKHDVVFSSDNIEAIVEMKKLISQFYDPRRSSDSAISISDDQEMFTDDENDWVMEDGKDASMN